LQPFKRGQGVAGLRDGQGGSLRAAGQFAHNALGSFAGVGIGREGLHPPFAHHGVRKAVVCEFSARRVNLRLAGAVTDRNWEPHATVSGSGIILCKLCANFLIIHVIIRNNWLQR
jgi:hypothetical protein